MTRHLRRTLVRSLVVAQLTALALTALVAQGPPARSSGTRTAATTPIQHVVIVLKENRSCDEYFGQFPNLVNGQTDYGTTTAKRSDGMTVPLAQTKEPTSNEIDHSTFAFNLACDLDKTVNPP